MTTELWIALLGFLTASVGAVRWLISVYYKQATKIEELRSSSQIKTISALEATVADHKIELRATRADLKRMEDRLVQVQGAIAKNTQDGEAIMTAMHDYIDTTATRISQIESQLIELSKRLVIIKGGGNGPAGK